MHRLDRGALAALGAPGALDELRREVRGGLLVVDLRGAGPIPPAVVEHLVAVPLVVVALGGSDDPVVRWLADVMVDDDHDAAVFTDRVEASPLAATALAVLLRGSEDRSIAEGLAAESACYSLLQAGPEFAAWLAARPRRDRPAEAEGRPPVRVERDGDLVRIVLQRPQVRNALDVAMRESLLDAFDLVAADPGVEAELSGDGPSFCSGGDLDEFGSFADPASAHMVRLARSVPRALAAVTDRVTARIHGPCVGSGVELPAFCGRVVADPGTTFALPEVAMGLVPGAGGTVSLPRRIGRHRTARLALTGQVIDAATALKWGLVDAVEPWRD